MEGQSVLKDYIHPVLNEEIRTISGHYILSSENRLPFNDRQVLYFTGGCGFLLLRYGRLRLCPGAGIHPAVEI
jgi:hypothetical protein